MMQWDFKNKVARMWGQTRVDARELGWALSVYMKYAPF